MHPEYIEGQSENPHRNSTTPLVLLYRKSRILGKSVTESGEVISQQVLKDGDKFAYKYTGDKEEKLGYTARMVHLFIVATPIGNLEDITLRALRVLKEVDAIFCEDTRVTGKLLAHFGISKPLVSLRERSQDRAIEKAAELLKQGKDIAYASDAGTPGVSDPGGKLISAVTLSLGYSVTVSPVPGPSALTAAASIAGIPMDRFLFLGFPPHKKGRKKFFEEVAASAYPVIFYESPHRILKSLRELDFAHKLSATSYKLLACRELTKKFETVYRGSIDEVLPQIEKNSRGEFVVIVAKGKESHGDS